MTMLFLAFALLSPAAFAETDPGYAQNQKTLYDYLLKSNPKFVQYEQDATALNGIHPEKSDIFAVMYVARLYSSCSSMIADEIALLAPVSADKDSRAKVKRRIGMLILGSKTDLGNLSRLSSASDQQAFLSLIKDLSLDISEFVTYISKFAESL